MTKSKNFVGNQPMDTGKIPKLGGKTSIKPREDNWWWRQTREETQNIKKKVEEKKTEEKERISVERKIKKVSKKKAETKGRESMEKWLKKPKIGGVTQINNIKP